MTRRCSQLLTRGGVTLLLLLLAPLAGRARAQAQSTTFSSATVSVFATGLNTPPGLTFGPDDKLSVAEGGLGGNLSTVGQCPQVPRALVIGILLILSETHLLRGIMLIQPPALDLI
jgi:hypothetical protein